nr:MAG TPA: hypothetical protein [Caudoviricetes sp.]
MLIGIPSILFNPNRIARNWSLCCVTEVTYLLFLFILHRL